MARDRFPGGMLIDFPYHEVDAKIAATKAALDDGAPDVPMRLHRRFPRMAL